jgi:hypothetical protein
MPAATSSGSAEAQSFNRHPGAPKAQAAVLPNLQAGALQPTPSPNRSPDPARQRALTPGLSLASARMRRSARKGTDGGHIGDGGASVPVIASGTDAFHRSDGAPKARAALLPGLKAARLQPTPSPNRSPAPARQPALAPGLSLVPHGCGDPLIRLVQVPQLNRVLEGWCASVARGRSRPVRSRGRGPGPAVVPGPGTGRQIHRRLQGRGCFQRGASLVCEAPLWSFDREAVERGGRRGPSAPFLRRRRSGLRPASRTGS